MSRRTATLSLLLGITASVALALPSLAKEGAEAKLDTAIHRDAAPGSTIEVGWSLFQVVDDKESPFSSLGRVYAPRGQSMARARPRSSARSRRSVPAITRPSIQVPESGIGEVEVGLRGESCTAADDCSRSDIIFPLTDDSMVTGHAPAAKAAAPIASTQPVASTPVAAPPVSTTPTTSVSSQLAPLVGIGVAMAIAAGAAALIIGRRRTVDVPAGR